MEALIAIPTTQDTESCQSARPGDEGGSGVVMAKSNLGSGFTLNLHGFITVHLQHSPRVLSKTHLDSEICQAHCTQLDQQFPALLTASQKGAQALTEEVRGTALPARAPQLILRCTQEGEPLKTEGAQESWQKDLKSVCSCYKIVGGWGCWREMKRKRNSREYSIMRMIK